MEMGEFVNRYADWGDWARERVPDLRNPGVIARVILVVNLLMAAAAALDPGRYADALLELALVTEPTLLIGLLLCHLAYPALRRMPYPFALVVVLAAMAMIAALVASYVGGGVVTLRLEPWRAALLAALVALIAAEYLRLRGRAFSPAISEARLHFLQARIRPHFLFNSLNAVLSLIRSDPARAEQVLEDLADLFRMLLADNAQLVPMAREVELVREYLRIESLRLGDRLHCEIHLDPAAEHALVPPLLLQPVAENAVYHGIEPWIEPGEVSIDITVSGQRVLVVVSNSWRPGANVRPGNGMAMSNIRERLALHFDAHASLHHGVVGDRYEVRVDLPLQRPGAGQMPVAA